MREIEAAKIVETVKELCIKANFELPEDVLQALRKGMETEESPVGKEIFRQLLENAEIAKNERIPICQDTGTAVVYIEMGQDVRIVGGYLYDAVNEGVRKGYIEGYLRKSIVGDPLRRKNTGDNTPAHIHVEVVQPSFKRVKLHFDRRELKVDFLDLANQHLSQESLQSRQHAHLRGGIARLGSLK